MEGSFPEINVTMTRVETAYGMFTNHFILSEQITADRYHE